MNLIYAGSMDPQLVCVLLRTSLSMGPSSSNGLNQSNWESWIVVNLGISK